jgi:hypothetical protein
MTPALLSLTSSLTSSLRRDEVGRAIPQTTSSRPSPPLRGTTWSAMLHDHVPDLVPEAQR